MFSETLKKAMYDSQAQHSDLKFCFVVRGVYRDVIWRFMDVLTRIISLVCPNYTKHVWNESILINKLFSFGSQSRVGKCASSQASS